MVEIVYANLEKLRMGMQLQGHVAINTAFLHVTVDSSRPYRVGGNYSGRGLLVLLQYKGTAQLNDTIFGSNNWKAGVEPALPQKVRLKITGGENWGNPLKVLEVMNEKENISVEVNSEPKVFGDSKDRIRTF